MQGATTTSNIKNKKGRKSVVLNSEAWLEFCKEREIVKTKSNQQVQDYGDSDSDETDRKKRNEGRKSIVMDPKAWQEHAAKIKKMIDSAEKNYSGGDSQKTNPSKLQSDAKVENFGDDSDEDEDD
mmetsp:Transcript_34437/g.47996  ORF Transcript_34437/g.47996 Transcript_34437/m.47996 type:complete len:125 (-) Transcript_34437:345-719(-)